MIGRRREIERQSRVAVPTLPRRTPATATPPRPNPAAARDELRALGVNCLDKDAARTWPSG